jgi:hypothetical protein
VVRHNAAAQGKKFIVREVVLGIIRPPRTHPKIRLTETIADMINTREKRKRCLIATSVRLRLIVAKRPISDQSSVSPV